MVGRDVAPEMRVAPIVALAVADSATLVQEATVVKCKAQADYEIFIKDSNAPRAFVIDVLETI